MSGVDYRSGWSDQPARRRGASLYIASAILFAGLLLIGIWWYQGHHHSGTTARKLVLRHGDVPGYSVKTADTAGPAFQGLLSRYSVLYALKDASQLINSPLAVASGVSIFNTATAAHAAFRRDVRALPKNRLAPPELGNETVFWATARGRTNWLLWRSGRILATVMTIGVEPGRRTDTVRFGELMQSRIAGAR